MGFLPSLPNWTSESARAYSNTASFEKFLILLPVRSSLSRTPVNFQRTSSYFTCSTYTVDTGTHTFLSFILQVFFVPGLLQRHRENKDKEHTVFWPIRSLFHEWEPIWMWYSTKVQLQKLKQNAERIKINSAYGVIKESFTEEVAFELVWKDE